MKIVILDGYALNPGDLDYGCLNQFGEVSVYDRTESEEEAVRRIGDAEILLLNKFPVTESLLEKCPSLRLICVQATGYNVVDCEAARKRNIPVCNVPCYGTDAVAQFTMALLLEICHQIGHHNLVVHQGKWCDSEIFCFWDTPQMELAGKTLGIIGFGRIGQAVARLAKAFGMQVIAHSRTEYPQGAELGKYVTLDELYSKADVISLHCPQLPETYRMINRESISKMKDGVILLNTSRGGLLDEIEVANALEQGKIRYAAVDVVSEEPMKRQNPLLSAPNCIITPHMAWAPVESRQRLLDCVVENIRMWRNGQPQNVVN